MSLVQSSISDPASPRDTPAYLKSPPLDKRLPKPLSLLSKHSLLFISRYRTLGVKIDLQGLTHGSTQKRQFSLRHSSACVTLHPVPPRGIVAFYIQHLASGIFPPGTSFSGSNLEHIHHCISLVTMSLIHKLQASTFRDSRKTHSKMLLHC